MELPTYTSIWRIEKRLYKLYDFRLPMPVPVGQIAVFTAITVPYVVLLTVLGLPFDHTLFWLYVLPPAVLTWLATRPVLESKRLPELLISQVRYLGEPSTWCRLAPLAEKDEVVVVGRVWRRDEDLAPSTSTEPQVQPQTAPSRPQPAVAPAAAQPARSAATARRSAAPPAWAVTATAPAVRPPARTGRPTARPVPERIRASAPAPGAARVAGTAAPAPGPAPVPPAPAGPPLPPLPAARPPAFPEATPSPQVRPAGRVPGAPRPAPSADSPTAAGLRPAEVRPAAWVPRAAEVRPAAAIPPAAETRPAAGAVPGAEVRPAAGIPSAAGARPAAEPPSATDVRPASQDRVTMFPARARAAGTGLPAAGAAGSPLAPAAAASAAPPADLAQAPAIPPVRPPEIAHDDRPELSAAAVVPLVVPPRRVSAAEARALGGPPFTEVAVSGGAMPEITDPGGHEAPGGHDSEDQEPGPGAVGPTRAPGDLVPVPDVPVPGEVVPDKAVPAEARQAEPLEAEVPQAEVPQAEVPQEAEAPQAEVPQEAEAPQAGGVGDRAASAGAPTATAAPPAVAEDPAGPPPEAVDPEAVDPEAVDPEAVDPEALDPEEPVTESPAPAEPGPPALDAAEAEPSGPGEPDAGPSEPPAVESGPEAQPAAAPGAPGAEPPSPNPWSPPVVVVRGGQHRPTVVERALSGPGQHHGGTTWRVPVRVIPGGHGPGRPDLERRDQDRVMLPIDGPRLTVVLGCTVGAGQTVSTLMLADVLASNRGEAVAALDLNPGRSSLAELARTVPVATARGLLAGEPPAAPAARGRGRLDVIAHEAMMDGRRDLNDTDFARIAAILTSRYPLTLADPGASAVARLLASADQLVLVAPASADASRAVAMTMEWLDSHGYPELCANSIAVINGVSKRSMTHVEQAELVVRGRCRAIVRVPWDDHLAEPPAEQGIRELRPVPGTPVSGFGQLRPQVQHAYTALAGVLMASLATAGGAQRRASR